MCYLSSIRFRWYQGFYPTSMKPVTWAIDNIYIGPQCEEMCNGHGSCVNGTKCICDPGYSGPTCKVSTKNPDFLKDDFEGKTVIHISLIIVKIIHILLLTFLHVEAITQYQIHHSTNTNRLH